MGCAKNGVPDKDTGLCDTCNGPYGSCKVQEAIIPEIKYTLSEIGTNSSVKNKKDAIQKCPSCHSEGDCQAWCDLR